MTTFMEPAAAEAEIQSNVAAIRAMKTVSGPPFPACGFSPFVWRAAGCAASIVGALLPFVLLTL